MGINTYIIRESSHYKGRIYVSVPFMVMLKLGHLA